MCFKAGTQAGRGICESIPDKLGGYGQSKGSRFISFITGEKILDFFYFFSVDTQGHDIASDYNDWNTFFLPLEGTEQSRRDSLTQISDFSRPHVCFAKLSVQN